MRVWTPADQASRSPPWVVSNEVISPRRSLRWLVSCSARLPGAGSGTDIGMLLEGEPRPDRRGYERGDELDPSDVPQEATQPGRRYRSDVPSREALPAAAEIHRLSWLNFRLRRPADRDAPPRTRTPSLASASRSNVPRSSSLQKDLGWEMDGWGREVLAK